MSEIDYKKLHKSWKTAKKDAKLIYDAWDRLHRDLSNAHEDVKFDLPAFPKFNLDLGPSLDNLEKKKDIPKNKLKATKAVVQYKKDINGLIKGVKEVEEPAKTDPQKDKKLKARNALIKYANDLMDVRDEIAKALDSLD